MYAVFNGVDASTESLTLINLHHKDVNFTKEKATDTGSLSFLDVKILLHDNGYDTCAWRKKKEQILIYC